MMACVDVDYREHESVAACVLFSHWTSALADAEWIERLPPPEPYQPGEFYRRELPCLLQVLQRAPVLQAVVIDGYVWLDADSRPGLGSHLYESLQRKVPVIGVAKTAFRGATFAMSVLRGESQSPLYVTAAGMRVELAAAGVQRMHGPYRLPTLLKRVDQLARQG